MNLAERLANLSPERRKLLERLSRPIQITRTGAREAPASFEQERMWFLQQLEPDDSSYHLHMQLSLPVDLDPKVLTSAWRYLVERHETLRTRFVENGGVPIQVIDEPDFAAIRVIDLTRSPASERRAAAARAARQQAETPFDLTHGPLFRIALLRMPDKWIQLLTIHHIVADGWSIDVLMRDLNVAYAALVRHSAISFPPLRVQFGDFARWQREQLTGADLEELLAFWTRYLDGAPDLILPTDRARPATSTHRAGTVARLIPASLRASLYELARRESATVFQVLLAAYATLLHRYTGQLDFVFGTPMANRNLPEVEDLIGFFLNTILLRVQLSPDQTFRQVLSVAREASVNAYSGQQLPFACLVQHLRPPRDLGRNPLYQATVQFMRSRHAGARTNPLLEEIGYQRSSTNVDLALDLFESDEGLLSRFEYNLDLFDESTVERMLDHWERLLGAATAAPDRSIGSLRLTTTGEEATFLRDWSGHRESPDAGWVFHGFGDHTAISAHRGRLSYAELDRLCGQLASVLRSRGAGPENVVAIQLADPLETIVAILASWRAEAAFVYLDPALPARRAACILDEVAPAVVLDDSPWWRRAVTAADVLLPVPLPPERLAAVIFTSGSTGVPKGVMIEHGALANQIRWLQSAISLTPADVILQKYSFSFDAALSELLSALSVGAELVVASDHGRDVDELIRLIQTRRVTVLDVVPSVLAVLLDHDGFGQCTSLRCIVVGGERLSQALVARLAECLPQVEIINAYGPTETTITAVAWHSPPGRHGPATAVAASPPPIGRPIPGNTVFVLDRELQPVPVGMSGELYLGGAGLARGYWKDDTLNRCRFVVNPFGPGRLFATGDRVRYRADGQLEFLGRLDQQVKLRGYRIELEEIEQALTGHPAVRAAAATLARMPAVLEREAQLLQWRLQQLSPPEAEFLYRFEIDQDQIRSQTMWRSTPAFNLYLNFQQPEFVGKLQPNQRNWVLQRTLDEAVDDLKALDVIAQRCVEGSQRPEMALDWSSSPAVYSEEQLLINGQQVMQAWERPLMEALAAATAASGGDIAEIGFGMGISATFLQQRGIRSHTIVECHPDVLAKIDTWRAKYPEARIEVVPSRWQDWVIEPASFDGVLFDTYPTSEEEYVAEVTTTPTYAASFFPVAHRILRPGGVFTYYTNEIDSLSRRHQRLLLEHFSSFTLSLVRNLEPPAGCQYWWADTMAIVKAVK